MIARRGGAPDTPSRDGRGKDVAALAFLATLTVGAAAAAPADIAAMHWRSIGPFRGGRVLAVAGVSDDRLHFYSGR